VAQVRPTSSAGEWPAEAELSVISTLLTFVTVAAEVFIAWHAWQQYKARNSTQGQQE
jgi:hypothetical protein